MEFGHRLFAQNKWWIKVRYIQKGFYMVVDPYAITPASIFLIRQTIGDALYQDILFQNFDKTKSILKNKK